MSSDQQTLFENSENAVPMSQESTKIRVAFVSLQLAQFAFFSIYMSECISLFLILLLSLFIVNFILCQQYFGRQLVGLSWKINPVGTIHSLYTYEIEPDPFVPTKVNSNTFWIFMTGSPFCWLIAALLILFSSRGWLATIIIIFIFLASTINLAVFFRVQRIATKMSAEAVRTVLLGKSQFPNAEEFSSSGDDEEISKKNSSETNTGNQTPVESNQDNKESPETQNEDEKA